MKERLEHHEGSSGKFWEVATEGSRMTVTFGKLGTAGQAKPKDFDSADAAESAATTLIAEKLKKGYRRAGASAPAVASAAAGEAAATCSAAGDALREDAGEELCPGDAPRGGERAAVVAHWFHLDYCWTHTQGRGQQPRCTQEPQGQSPSTVHGRGWHSPATQICAGPQGRPSGWSQGPGQPVSHLPASQTSFLPSQSSSL